MRRPPVAQLSCINRCRDLGTESFEHLRFFHCARVPPQLHTRPARDNMDMQVEYRLAAGGFVILKEGDSIRRERLLDRTRDFLHPRYQRSKHFGVGIENIA